MTTDDEAVEDLLGSLHDLRLLDKRREELRDIFMAKLAPLINDPLTAEAGSRIGQVIGEEIRSFRRRHGDELVEPTITFDEATQRIVVSITFPAVLDEIDLHLIV